jgi:Protein of unknown function (DUF1302)
MHAKRPHGALVLLLVISTVGLLSVPARAETTVDGYVRTYMGVLTNEDMDFAIMQNTLDLRLRHTGSKGAFLANPYLYHNDDNSLEMGLRQAYVDLYFSWMDLRVGKQQVVWGKADGVFITDVVSPKDLQEFLLPDFEEIRLGVTAVRANFYVDEHTVELIWVPMFTPTGMPGQGSIWLPSAAMPAGVVLDTSRQDVPLALESSELFARYSVMSSWGDLELVGAWMWDDDPALHRKVAMDAQTGLPAVTITPEHHRLPMGGVSFSTVTGPFVLKTEAAYYHEKRFQTEALSDPDGLLEKSYAHWMVGANVKIWEINTGLQYVQRAIIDYDDEQVAEQFDHTVTVQLSMDFLRETLHISLFSYIGVEPWNALVRPTISYDFPGGIQALVGTNLFIGDEGTFGQFDSNDMVYAKLKYAF